MIRCRDLAPRRLAGRLAGRLRVAVAIVIAALAAVIGAAAPASAHASLVDAQPADGAIVSTAPAQVQLRFSEAVEVSLGAIRVLDAQGKELRVGRPRHGDDDTVVLVDLPSLGNGTFVVAWRVVSADAHPVGGAYTFSVGKPSAAASSLGALTRTPRASTAVGWAYGVVRWCAFASLLVLVGAGAFVALLWPAGAANRRVRTLLWVSAVVALVSSVVGIALQGAYSVAGAAGDIVDSSLWGDVLRTRFGRWWATRFVVLAVVAVPLLARLQWRPHVARWGSWRLPASLAGVALLVTVAGAGHGATGRWIPVAFGADVVHLGAAACWLGGLAVLVIAALAPGALAQGEPVAASPAGSSPPGAAKAVGAATLDDPRPEVEPGPPTGAPSELGLLVWRYSHLAFWSVIALVGAGLVQAYRQLDGPDSLTSTTYGRLLLAKTIAVAVTLVIAGAKSQRIAHTTADRRALRGAVAAEMVTIAVVLGITAGLVSTAPARTEAPSGPVSFTKASGNAEVDVTVNPARVGANTLHLTISTPAGALAKVADVKVTLSLPSRQLGPLSVPLDTITPTHYTSSSMQIPYAGRWTLSVTGRIGDFDAISAQMELVVR